MTLKAIETSYKGYRFRSRKEARFAVFLDALCIKYRYEPEGFDLGNGVYYLPDFWLPDYELWVEIKGVEPTDDEIVKAALLAQQSKQPAAIFWGDFSLDEGDTFYCYEDGEGVFYSFTNKGVWEVLTGTRSPWGNELLERANEAARGARFD